MVSILLMLIMQSQAPAGQSAESGISLDRVREGLLRPSRLEVPPPPSTDRPLFRIQVEERSPLVGDAWHDTSVVPSWIRPSAPPVHFEFLMSGTPEEFRSSTVYPCCDILPLINAIRKTVSQGLRAAKQQRAKQEVERVMRAAGIQPSTDHQSQTGHPIAQSSRRP